MYSSARQSYHALNTLQKLIVVNVIIFLIVNIGNIIFRLFNFPGNYLSDFVSDWLAVPSSLTTLLSRPWTVLTYCFYHEQFFHILFNMLWLFYMGRLFMEYFGEKKIVPVYLLGGICGSLFFIAFYNFFPLFNKEVEFAIALGASASVLAITAAIATLLPNYEISLFLPQWRVKLKYIAIALFLMDLLSITGVNAGGNIAHIGGAVFGFIFTKQLSRGNDITAWLQKLLNYAGNSVGNSGRFKVVHRSKKSDENFRVKKASEQEIIDKILDKISRSGYASLSNAEKELLFKASKNKN